ncbi:tumor necrosis factor receptor superfamily member 14 isoform X3 [Gadus morhua]|uniref:tumor necrosis factor receptor superfamily member 14 isoform X3 n=1 Tax=Gadus morhua TaxID=8049 RepID=UPI0011B69713|nr:tumor necrosis factor receptor superfamily member 14-like isoform X3 [Gadus morhua]
MRIMWIFMVICLAVSCLSVYHAITFGPCPWDEYRVGFECCPLCHPGSYFVMDCTEKKITNCSWCPDGTFKEGLDLKKECSTCTKCDAGLGLKVKKSCSSTSDAVCEVLDGFFCSDSNGGGCRAAQRHTVCSPGHYIGQRGTAVKDTECLHCTDGTFSNGTSTSCQNHTNCESVGLNLMKPGTDSTDSECGEHGQHRGLERGHVAGIVIPGVILVMALIIIAIIHRKKIREWRLTSKMETLSQELSQGCCLTGIYTPAPTRDQQEHPTTTPAAAMDDHDGDQSLGPPQAPHNGSVLLPQHPEVNQTVLFRTDGGQLLCPPHSGSPLSLPVHPPHSGAPLPLPVHPPQSG